MHSSLLGVLSTAMLILPLALAVPQPPCSDIVPVCRPTEELCGRCMNECCLKIEARVGGCPPIPPVPCAENQHNCGPCGIKCCENTTKRLAKPETDSAACPNIIRLCPSGEHNCGECVRHSRSSEDKTDRHETLTRCTRVKNAVQATPRASQLLSEEAVRTLSLYVQLVNTTVVTVYVVSLLEVAETHMMGQGLQCCPGNLDCLPPTETSAAALKRGAEAKAVSEPRICPDIRRVCPAGQVNCGDCVSSLFLLQSADLMQRSYPCRRT